MSPAEITPSEYFIETFIAFSNACFSEDVNVSPELYVIVPLLTDPDEERTPVTSPSFITLILNTTLSPGAFRVTCGNETEVVESNVTEVAAQVAYPCVVTSFVSVDKCAKWIFQVESLPCTCALPLILSVWLNAAYTTVIATIPTNNAITNIFFVLSFINIPPIMI